MPIPAMAPGSQIYSVPSRSSQLSTLNASSPLAAFTYTPCVACASIGQPVFFNASWSISPNGPIVSYTWNFGDGTPPVKTNNTSVSHVYLSAATIWQVSLTVQDSAGQMETVSQSVMFNVQPAFVFQPAKPAVGQTVSFDASSTMIYFSPNSLLAFQWSFGDGASGSGKLTIHAYAAAGPNRVLLTVETSQGNAQISKTIIVGSPSPPPPPPNLVLQSVFGIAFYNSSGKITIQPASVFLNWTFLETNSSGNKWGTNAGNIMDRPMITIGPSSSLPVQRNFTATSGEAFRFNTGRLVITAVVVEVYSCQLRQPACTVPNTIYQVYLTGPSRVVSSANNNLVAFTRLFGFLYNSQTRIGLFFVAGVSPGDVDESGTVDVRDLSTAASCFGTDTVQSSTTAPSTSSDGYSSAYYADMNGDGRVDIQDVSSIAVSFGQTY
jgi:PKD repeat protein